MNLTRSSQSHQILGQTAAPPLSPRIRDGRLAAVLDFGGLAVGDPSVDLIAAWEVLDARGRQTFRQALDVDDATWVKGMGWALLVAMITFPYYWHTMPARCAARLSMAQAVLSSRP